MAFSLVLKPSEGEMLSVVGESIRILADAKTTDGKFVAFETVSAPGHGPPMHRHNRDDEFFFILEGTVKFSIDGKESVLSTGGTAFAPKGCVHTFVNAGKAPSRMLTVCTPAGLEVPFREVDQLTRQNNANPQTIAAAFKKFDLEVIGPPLQP